MARECGRPIVSGLRAPFDDCDLRRVGYSAHSPAYVEASQGGQLQRGPPVSVIFRVMRTIASPLILALPPLFVARLDAQVRPRRVDQFLTSVVHLDEGQLASLSRGDVVAKVLPTSLDRDVTVFAAIHVNASSAEFVERQRDPKHTLQSPTRTAGAVFHTPATEADVRDIAVTRDDVAELRKCKPNDCNFKLPAADMERLRATIDWSSPDAADRVADYVRQRMMDYVSAYREHGDSAMVVYGDNGNVSASDALLAMMSDSSFAPSGTATLLRHLTDYPRDSLAGATDVLFWSVDNLPHARPILRITHETIYAPPELPGATIVAQKQIYADHYFEAALELVAAIDDSTTTMAETRAAGFTLIAIRRYRFDHLPRGGIFNLRGRVIGGLRDALRADLVRWRREAESS